MRHIVAALPLIPLGAALLVAFPAIPARARQLLMPAAAVPALIVALFGGEVAAHHVHWALLETWAGVDSIARVWLFLTAFLWAIAGAYAVGYQANDPRRSRFALFFLLTMAGNLGLVVAQDLASFYLGFALMTFAGYGLVIHTGSDQAYRAGRIYLVMAVIGETMLLAGFMLAAVNAPSLALPDIGHSIAVAPRRDLIIGLLLAGFGVKAGAIPLHMWLPLAHPVAPTPASAVLSGAMIKAGLLGWIRFLPLGAESLPGWGAMVIALGLAAAFFGVIVGVTQRDAKTTLAYSSISQMGLLNVAVGAALASPDAWPAATAALLAYVVHHGLAKGALFLGVGVAGAADTVVRRRVALAGLALAALSIAGAPLTSGSIAKGALKTVVPFAPLWWAQALDLVLPLAALGSTLLMARFLALVSAQPGAARGGAVFNSLAVPWLALVAAVAAVMWLLPGWYELDLGAPRLTDAGALWVSIWPIVAGILIAWLVAGRRGLMSRFVIAPGDVVVPLERLSRSVIGGIRNRGIPEAATPVQSIASQWYGIYAAGGADDPASAGEARLTRWQVAMALMLMLAALLAVALVAG